MPNFIERCPRPSGRFNIESNHDPAETAPAFPAAASRRWPSDAADRERFEKPF